LAAVSFLSFALSPRLVLAYRVGISGYSGEFGSICNACHSGGEPPTVSLTGPTTLDAGKKGTFTFTVQSAAPQVQRGAGLDVGANAGTFTKGSGSKLLPLGCTGANCDVTHTLPKTNNASGIASWTFQWTAPSVPGNYILWGAGNSVNLDGTFNGDAAASTMIFVAVGGVDTVTPTVPATLTPTRTGTPTSTPTVAATSTPTVSPTFTATGAVSPVSTDTPTDTPTPTETETPTLSPTEPVNPTQTPTDTPTATPTASPTPSLPADANCDDRVTAADLPALVIQLAAIAAPSCGADTDGSGTVDETDIAIAVDLIFAR